MRGFPVPAEPRYLNLNVYLRNSGYHEAAWQVSPADPAAALDPLQLLSAVAGSL